MKVQSRLFFAVFLLIVISYLTSVYYGAGEVEPPPYSPGEKILISAPQAGLWLEDKRLAFVQFSTPSCPRCTEVTEVMKAFVAEQSLHYAYVDTLSRKNQEWAVEIGVEFIPSIVAFVDGQSIEPILVGTINYDDLQKFLYHSIE